MKLYIKTESRNEYAEKWRESLDIIPFFEVPQGYKIKVIPPYAGAVARFMVEKDGKKISVYLDFYDALGVVGEPYWEIYPNKEGDCDRFLLNDVDELWQGIKRAIEEGGGL